MGINWMGKFRNQSPCPSPPTHPVPAPLIFSGPPPRLDEGFLKKGEDRAAEPEKPVAGNEPLTVSEARAGASRNRAVIGCS